MDGPALAQLADLEARMGVVADEARARAALDDASALIRSEAGAEDWLDGDGNLEVVPSIVVTVCCKVAQRVLTNPDGVTNETIGSFSHSLTSSSSDAYLTKAERRLVRKAAGSSLIGSVELESPYRRYSADDLYVSVAGGGDDLLMGPWPEST